MKQNRVFEWRWIVLIGVSVLVFFPEILFLQKGFLSGDHRLQHYPWFFYYAQGIKKLTLPWWTSFNQCGFPLLAEGQVGAFYPLNFIFAFFFPVRLGYNYSVLTHYFLGGIFFFLYVRKIGLSPAAAFWSTLIFLFGSSQGGFFYNITSQRVLIWFPLSLWLIHRILEKRTWREAVGLGMVFGLETLGGYQQYAVYAVAFACLYFLILWLDKKPFHTRKAKGKELLLLLGAVAFSFLVALPQWVPFLELSRLSARRDLTEAFAYIGSMNPLGPLTLFFPSWQGLLNAELYAGVLGIFFALYTFWGVHNATVRTHWILFGVALLLAWGGFSPLYIPLIKLTHFYGFRIPVKFLFFASFSLAVLSGWGMHQWLDPTFKDSRERLKRAFSFFIKLSLGLWGSVTVAAIVVRAARRPILGLLEGAVRQSIVGQPYRPHSEEVYLEKLRSFYEHALRNIHPLNPWLLGTLVIFLISIFLLAALLRKKPASQGPWVLLMFLLLYGDLYAYGYRNIRGDYENFSFVHRPSALLNQMRSDVSNSTSFDASFFRVYNFSPEVSREDVLLASNSNIVDGIENIGIYSPFAFRFYKELVTDLGVVDDSIDTGKTSKEALYQRLDLLRSLNVKYVISNHPLRHSDLKEAVRDETHLLYELKGTVPRLLFAEENEMAKPLVVEQMDRGPNRLQVVFRAPARGFFILNEMNYPGWHAKLDGKDAAMVPALELFRRFEVPQEGLHRLEMTFRPSYFYPTLAASLLSLFIFLCSLGKNFLPGIFLVWNLAVAVCYFAMVIYGKSGP